MKAPDPIDLHIGAFMTRRRTELRLSQTAVAGRLGISFQQIQKYERGQNRIAASRLHRLAEALDTPVQDFFPGADAPPIPVTAASEQAARGLAESIMRISNSRLRTAISRVIHALASPG